VGAWQVLPNESRLAIYMCLCLTQPGSASSTHRRPLSFIARKARINSKTATEQKKKIENCVKPQSVGRNISILPVETQLSTLRLFV